MNTIYISSLPRSGSTLLSMLVGSHERVFPLGEFVLFGQSLKQNASCTCGKPIRECDFWGKVAEKLHPQADYYPTLVYPFDYDTSRLQRRLVKLFSYALIHHNRFLLDLASGFKNGYPYHMKMAMDNSIALLELLSDQFLPPGILFLDATKTTTRLNHLITKKPFSVRVITLVRDGRGTVNSWLKDGKESFADTVRSWRFHMETQQASIKSIRSGDKILVRYEELCTNTERELKRLCDFMEIPFQEKMMKMEGPFHMLGGNPGTFGGPTSIRLDTGWEQSFNQEQLKVFDDLAGPLNRELGY